MTEKMKKIKKWIMFLEGSEIPNDIIKNVKYMIKYEDSEKIHVMSHMFRKPVNNCIIDFVNIDF